MVVPMFHFFQAKTAKAISAPRPDDADDQRAADTPLVAQRKLEEGGEGFGKQCGTGLAHDDCGERAGEQPESVEQTLETGGHALEQGQRGGADNVPAPENDAGCDGDDCGDDDIDDAPLVIGFGHSFSHECAFLLLVRRPNIHGYMYAHDAHVRGHARVGSGTGG